jgi:nucleotide-binding universal stress UspA family protein
MKMVMAVDGSEASLRAVDHLSFMLGGNEEMTLTLFHVTPMLRNYCPIDLKEEAGDAGEIVVRGASRCVDHFFAHARDKFTEAGVRDDQVELKVVKRTVDIGKAIVSQIGQEDYGTVIIGRRGADQAFFMGSVSRYVLDKTHGRALWVVS